MDQVKPQPVTDMTYDGEDEDRRFVARSAEELAQYLSADVLLWRMSGIDLPLCPGNLLLALRKLSVIREYAELTSISQIMTMIDQRYTQWQKKVNRELPMRGNQWQELVKDFHRNGGIDASFYYSVRVRVILALLSIESRTTDHKVLQQINSADEVLGLLVQPGEFAWNPGLRKAFPKETYPYLYYEQAGK
jgi:hypothetical protein